jgi:hypothetical protein
MKPRHKVEVEFKDGTKAELATLELHINPKGDVNCFGAINMATQMSSGGIEKDIKQIIVTMNALTL